MENHVSVEFSFACFFCWLLINRLLMALVHGFDICAPTMLTHLSHLWFHISPPKWSHDCPPLRFPVCPASVPPCVFTTVILSGFTSVPPYGFTTVTPYGFTSAPCYGFTSVPTTLMVSRLSPRMVSHICIPHNTQTQGRHRNPRKYIRNQENHPNRLICCCIFPYRPRF